MAYKIVNQMNPNMYTYNAPYSMNPIEICIHNTANTATARNEVAYMNRTANYTSYHVAIDDKEAVQAIPFNRNAFAAGDGVNGRGNRRAIHIEICYSLDGGNNGHQSARYLKAEENAALYTAHVLHQYGWGVDKVKKHQDYSGKYCPHVILANGKWQWFKNRVQAHLNALKKGSTAPAKPVTKKPAKKPASKPAKKPAKKRKIAWDWAGTFTANTTIAVRQLKKGQTIPSLTSTLVGKDSYIYKGQWVNWDRLYYIQGYWWVRFKYPTNPSAGYFYMTVGKKESGVTFGQANSKNKLWGTVSSMKTKEGNTKVTNWKKKGAVK